MLADARSGGVARRDAAVADVLWGPAFAALAWLYVVRCEAAGPRGLLVALLVMMWGLRLGVHLALRGQGRGEDPRYGAMRRAHGSRFWWVSLFTVFWLQGLILWIVALPLLWWGIFLLAARTPAGWVTIVSPLLMTFLLLRLSGLTLLERGLVETRPGYDEYVRRTSAFVP